MTVTFIIVSAIVFSLLLAAIPNIIFLLAWLGSKIFNYSLPYPPFGWSALALVVLCWMILAYGFIFGRFRLTINNLTYENSLIPKSFDGYRIVHISDLHLSTFDDRPQQLKRFVDSINAQNPDLICFTGDLTTFGVKEAAPHTETLKRLHAKDGIISVLGNHDFAIYAHQLDNKGKLDAVCQLDTFERQDLGWILLRNGHHILNRGNDSITIIGVDNISSRGQGFETINSGDLQKAMQGTGGFRILLTHDPSHWRGEVLQQTDIPLTLSGHTHAGQIRIFGKNLSDLMFKESAGLYREGTQTLYVNIGLGCTLPIRLNAPAEITVITLRSTEN